MHDDAKAKPKICPSQKFIKAAHMIEADKDEAEFEKRLKKIAKAKPKSTGQRAKV